MVIKLYVMIKLSRKKIVCTCTEVGWSWRAGMTVIGLVGGMSAMGGQVGLAGG